MSVTSFKKSLGAIGLFALLSVSAPASANCGYLNVHLSTQHGKSCTLKSYQIDNGYYVHIISGSVPKHLNGSALPIVIKQFPNPITGDLYGANITITYICDKKTITIRSHQNYCYAKAGHISGSANQPKSVVSYTAKKGAWWSTPGNIYWKFH